MADESENVGGISIEASIDDSRIDSEGAALLAKMQALASRLSQALSPVANINVGTGAAPGRAPAAPQPAKITFGAAARGFRGDQSRFDQMVAAELAKQGEQLVDGVVVAIDKSKTNTTRQVAAAINAPGAGESTKVELDLDTAEFMREFARFMSTFKEGMNEVQESAKVEVKPKTAGGGGGLRRKNLVGAGAEDDDEGESTFDKRRKLLRTRAEGTEVDPRKIYTFDPEVEAERERREITARQRRTNATAVALGKGPDKITPGEQAILDALPTGKGLPRAALAVPEQVDQPGPATSSTFAPRRSDDEIAAASRRTPREIAAEAEVRRQAEARLNSEEHRARRAAIDAEAERANRPRETAGEEVRGGTRGRGATEEDILRRGEQARAAALAQRVAAPRTFRTGVSGLFGTFGGAGQEQIEAITAQREAEQLRNVAAKRLFDPEIKSDANATQKALEELAVAETNLGKATERVQKLGSPLVGIKTLAAIGVGTFLLSKGLQVSGVAMDAFDKSLGDVIDTASGFNAVSNKVTNALATQTRAVHGNVEAVLAQQAVEAGLAGTTAEVLDQQLRLTAQVKAGAQAAQQQGGLFRAAIGQNQQVPQGLLGGFGGFANSPFLAQQLGGGAGLAETIQSTFGDITKSLDTLSQNRVVQPSNLRAQQGLTLSQRRDLAVPLDQRTGEIERLSKDRVAYEASLNQAAKRGAEAMGLTSAQIVHFGQINEDEAKAIAASNLPDELKNLARDSREALRDASGNLITTFKAATDGLSQVGVGLGIPDQAQLSRLAAAQEQQRQRESRASIDAIREQQKFVQPSIIEGARRQQDFALNQQQPAELALQNLVSPLRAPGTGIAAANADEQARIESSIAESRDLQKDLNAQYEKGRQVIEDTYKPAIIKNFGAAAGQAFSQALSTVQSIGAEITAVSSGLANKQAAYQVAQYNYQLFIARRTLSDIGGLTNRNFGEGQSYLGILERQNLALSRQGQLLQFELSQRQINFNLAVAGFQAPGVTPEERQANVKEAQIEAEYAQKQLDIQRQMFGNQVQIVDISNLRQGADLAQQISLLLQGRELTIDTQTANEKIDLLQKKQSIALNQVSTYFSSVNNLTAVAFGQIQQLEAAGGKAMYSTAYAVLDSFGIVLNGLTTRLNQTYNGISDTNSETAGNRPLNASGAVGLTGGKTDLGWAGEANGEAVAIIRHPQAIQDLAGLGGGSGVIVFDIHDNSVRDDSDIDRIVREVVAQMGNRMALTGLRLGN